MHTRVAKLACDPQEVFDAFEALAHSNGFTSKRDRNILSVIAPLGKVTFDRDSSGVLVRFSSGTAAELQLFSDLYAQRFDKLGFGNSVKWNKVTERAPLNQILCEILAKFQISPNFARLRLKGNFQPFLDPEAGLHFRLLFGPQIGEWPFLNAGGVTQWPGGITAWHRPPYTVRRIDGDGRWIDVDVVLHEGGRVTNWYQSVQPGDTIAIHGPSGSKQPKAGWLGLFGDETALPVIAHMLERTPAATTGQATIIVRDLADRQELSMQADIDLTWLTSGDNRSIESAIDKLTIPQDDRFLFFAGERSQAAVIRQLFKEKGLESSECKSASYWTRAD